MMKSKFTRIAVVALTVLSLSGCANMDENQQRMVSGGAVGVVAGALTTVVTGGCIACGMAIGGAVGSVGGYALGKIDNSTRSSPPGPTVQNSSGYVNGVPQGYSGSGSSY